MSESGYLFLRGDLLLTLFWGIFFCSTSYNQQLFGFSHVGLFSCGFAVKFDALSLSLRFFLEIPVDAFSISDVSSLVSEFL